MSALRSSGSSEGIGHKAVRTQVCSRNVWKLQDHWAEDRKGKKTPPPNLKSQGDISQAEEGLGGRIGGEFPLRRSISEKQRGKSAQLLLEYASGSVEQETETIRR